MAGEFGGRWWVVVLVGWVLVVLCGARDSVTGVFCGTMASEFGGWRVSLVDGG